QMPSPGATSTSSSVVFTVNVAARDIGAVASIATSAIGRHLSPALELIMPPRPGGRVRFGTAEASMGDGLTAGDHARSKEFCPSPNDAAHNGWERGSWRVSEPVVGTGRPRVGESRTPVSGCTPPSIGAKDARSPADGAQVQAQGRGIAAPWDTDSAAAAAQAGMAAVWAAAGRCTVAAEPDG